jgi:hypothetical protein
MLLGIAYLEQEIQGTIYKRHARHSSWCKCMDVKASLYFDLCGFSYIFGVESFNLTGYIFFAIDGLTG